MGIIPQLIHLGGIVGYPRDVILRNIDANRPETGWEFLRMKYAKHFGFGLEVRGTAPRFAGIDEIAALAREGITIALKRYGDMLVDPDVLAYEGALPPEGAVMIGYPVDLAADRDYTKPVLIDIVYDEAARSYRISGVVFDHVIDGVPLALLIQLVHNHLILRGDSYLSASTRDGGRRYRERAALRLGRLSRMSWDEIRHGTESSLPPVGAQIDVTGSAVVDLRSRIAIDTGTRIPVSAVELALAAMELGMDWCCDCVSQLKPGGVQDGYQGLGFVRTFGYARIAELPAVEQYAALRRLLADAALETDRERGCEGSSSVLYDRYRRIPKFWVDLFDRRIGYDAVMSVAGTQLLGSNLNGVAYGVPVCVGGVDADSIRYFFIPSHSEHRGETRQARAARNLDTHVTEVSMCCAPRVTMRDGRRVMYKSIKAMPVIARRILARWGYDGAPSRPIHGIQAVEALYRELYRPDAPAEGRIERRARSLLGVL